MSKLFYKSKIFSVYLVHLTNLLRSNPNPTQSDPLIIMAGSILAVYCVKYIYSTYSTIHSVCVHSAACVHFLSRFSLEP